MITIKRTFCPGRGMIRPEELTGYVFSPEAAAHTFIITKMEKVDGQEAAVPFDAGTDISCRFIKANGVTELVDGDLTNDGAASITLPAECYQVPGRFILSIYAETSEETICIYSATATALAGDTEEINVSGNTKRTIDAQIAALNDAVENAQETVEQVQEVIDSIPQDYTALSDSVSDLKSAVIVDEETEKIVDHADSVGTSVIADTRRWFFSEIVPSGAHINLIKYRTASSVSGTVEFEIWEKTGNLLTRKLVISSTPTASSTINVPVDYTAQRTCMISVKPVGGTSIRRDSAESYTWLVSTDLSGTTLNYSELTSMDAQIPCAQIGYDLTTYHFISLPKNVVVVGDGQPFTEIQQALLSITDDSANNPYTIILLPRSSPYERFSMIRDSFADTYPWSDVKPRYISIIGLDKAHCIIQSDSGDYKLPCGEPLTNGEIKNITFRMTNDGQTATATKSGYCLHIDCRTLNNAGYKMVIEDCDFENASGPCLGIGVHQDCHLIIRRCHFHTTVSENYNPHDGFTNLYDYGCIFAHSSSVSATGQHLTIEDCTGVCERGTRSLRINVTEQYDSESEFVYTLIRNVFWNVSANAPAYSISQSLTADPMNFGNNNQ